MVGGSSLHVTDVALPSGKHGNFQPSPYKGYYLVNGIYVSGSPNSLKGGYIGRGLYRGLLLGVTKGDTRSLDYSSYELLSILLRLTTGPLSVDIGDPWVVQCSP